MDEEYIKEYLELKRKARVYYNTIINEQEKYNTEEDNE